VTVPDNRPPETDRPLPPSAVYKDSAGMAPNTPKQEQPRSMPPKQPMPPGQSMSVADVKALVKSGVSDQVVISQIQNSRVVFRLTTQEIIDLKESGVSEKVIDFMINTPDRR
jgi:hypothetical protein